MLFTDRADAGRRLAEALQHLREERPLVLGLPRGGVPVAFQVAKALCAPLDVIVVRKLGVPYHPELGFGAIGEGRVRVLSEDVVRLSGVEPDDILSVEHAEEAELARQARRFRDGRERAPVEGRTVLVVDDGIATGATAAVACQVARAQGAARVVLAVPVAPPDSVERLRTAVDELVCLATPPAFRAVGEWYENFAQTSDEEVISLLARSTAPPAPVSAPAPVSPPAPARSHPASAVEVEVDAGTARLTGDLTLPEGAGGIVMFAHGSGSSRRSPRNRAVAAELHKAGLGTLLFDLLTSDEEGDRANVFDIETLAARLSAATRWLRRRESLPISYFGASTGAAAALWAAGASAPDGGAGADVDAGADVAAETHAGAGPHICAIVSRGGRPDLARKRLSRVQAPTLLIVGGHDPTVLDLNRSAQAQLRCENRLEVVPGATHLFSEPGALETVADLTRGWFLRHLATR